MIKKELNPEQGNRLRECLKDKRMSQKELSVKSGYTPQHINNIIGGTRNMSQESAEAFANILKVRKEYLLCKDSYKTLDDRFGKAYEEGSILREAVLSMLKVFGISTGEPYVEEWSAKEIENHNKLYGDQLILIRRSTDMIRICIDNEEPLEVRYETFLNYVEKIIEYAMFQAERLKDDYTALEMEQMRRQQQLRLDENLPFITVIPNKTKGSDTD